MVLSIAMLTSMGSVFAEDAGIMPLQAFTVCPTCKISPNVTRGSDVFTKTYYRDCQRNPARDDEVREGYYPETTYCPNCGYSQQMNVSFTRVNCTH